MSPEGSDTREGPKVLVCTTGKGPNGAGSELEKAIRITPKKGRS